jgi:hypothetical protein
MLAKTRVIGGFGIATVFESELAGPYVGLLSRLVDLQMVTLTIDGRSRERPAAVRFSVH